MNFVRQFFGILRVNLSGAAQRMGAVSTIIVGVACAVGVLVSMLAMGTGMQRQALENVRADRVILTSTGTRGMQSSIPRDEAVIARELPGIK
jgi:ABC-type lipoprotein release transport system permease subunit